LSALPFLRIFAPSAANLGGARLSFLLSDAEAKVGRASGDKEL